MLRKRIFSRAALLSTLPTPAMGESRTAGFSFLKRHTCAALALYKQAVYHPVNRSLIRRSAQREGNRPTADQTRQGIFALDERPNAHGNAFQNAGCDAPDKIEP